MMTLCLTSRMTYVRVLIQPIRNLEPEVGCVSKGVGRHTAFILL